MNILSRILRKLKPAGRVNVLTTVNETSGLHVVNQDVEVQTRNSPDVPQAIVEKITQFCENTPEIERCHILDVYNPRVSEQGIKKFIVVSIDNDSELEDVGFKIQVVLQEYPQFAQNYFVASSNTFPDIFEKAEFALYIR